MIFVILLTTGVAICTFIYSMFLFQEKGPVPMTEYILAKTEERKKMKTKANYHFTGIIMLTISLIYTLMTIGMISSIKWMYIVILAISAVLIIYVVAYSISEEKKGKSL